MNPHLVYKFPDTERVYVWEDYIFAEYNNPTRDCAIYKREKYIDTISHEDISDNTDNITTITSIVNTYLGPIIVILTKGILRVDATSGAYKLIEYQKIDIYAIKSRKYILGLYDDGEARNTKYYSVLPLWDKIYVIIERKPLNIIYIMSYYGEILKTFHYSYRKSLKTAEDIHAFTNDFTPGGECAQYYSYEISDNSAVLNTWNPRNWRLYPQWWRDKIRAICLALNYLPVDVINLVIAHIPCYVEFAKKD